MTTTSQTEDGITFFGADPSDVLAAFHASGMSARGYSISGRIVRQSARLIGQDGRSDSLFGGTLYAGTFVRGAN